MRRRARRRRSASAAARAPARSRCAAAGRRRTRAGSGCNARARGRRSRESPPTRRFCSAWLPRLWIRIGSDTIVPTRLRGLSDAYGSWKTICTSRRNGRMARVPRCSMCLPSKMISPSVGSSSRTMVRPSVDLPHPDSPTSPSVSPSRTAKLTSSTACTFATARCMTPWRIGKYFLTWRTSSSGVSPDSAPWSRAVTPLLPSPARSSRRDGRACTRRRASNGRDGPGCRRGSRAAAPACTSRTRADSGGGTCSPPAG